MLKSLKRTISNYSDFLLSEENLMIKQIAKDFAEENLLPNSSKWDKNSTFPVDIIKKSAELGFGGLYVSEDYGGSGLSRLDASLVFEPETSIALGFGTTGISMLRFSPPIQPLGKRQQR